MRLLQKGGTGAKDILFGRYEIAEPLKKGGSSQVYLAKHTQLDCMCLVKRIYKSSFSKDSFQREAAILKYLKHPDIPILYDIQEDEKYYYLIEEFFQGDTLDIYVKNQRLTEREAVDFMLKLADLILYLHNQKPDGILYLDLQPRNILLYKGRVRLCDFGSARWERESENAKGWFGTPGFAAPEQYGQGEVSVQTDLYGMGAVCYYILTGNQPSEAMEAVSKSLQDIIKCCMRHNPRERYASVEELKEAFLKAYGIKKEIQKQSVRQPSLTISIAGAVPSAGVTHFCFAFASYLKRKKIPCLYHEKNNSGGVFALASNKKIEAREGIYYYRHIPMLPNYGANIKKPALEYGIVLLDFGMLTAENREEYFQGALRLLVINQKPWHPLFRPEAMGENRDFAFLLNFSDAGNFSVWKKSIKGKSFRIPYSPDPFAGEKAMEAFLSDLFDRYIACKMEKNNSSRRWKQSLCRVKQKLRLLFQQRRAAEPPI